MTTFSFDDTIPATNNSPSSDQPGMLINNASTKAILAIDHVTFGSANGGTHLQMTLDSINVPGGQSNPACTIYSNIGTANAASNAFVKNSQGIFPMSLIKAAGSFTDSAATATFISSINCSTISYAANVFTITLTANATTGDNVIVFTAVESAANPPTTSTLEPGYYFTGGVLKIRSFALASQTISFLILQV